MKRCQNIQLPFVLCMIACVCTALFALVGCGASATAQDGSQRSDSDNVLEHEVVEEFVYDEGIHHAELVFDGYEDRPLEIEIYSHSAPFTAEKFCRLVDAGFYNGKPVFWILNEMYLRVGNTQQDNDYLITGEYEESEVRNSNSLKRGVIAMNRAIDGQQSDASCLLIFMSDLSFLDGKYAGFAKITENFEVIEEIAKRTVSGNEEERIIVDDNGRIIDAAQYPHIKSITMVD